MVLLRLPLLFVVGFVHLCAAQSSTPPPSATSASSSSPTAKPGTRSGTQTAKEITTFPPNGTITLSANGTATATVVNGTVVNATTPTSTSTTAFPTLSGVPSCVVGCLDTSISGANCSSITDVACFCSSTTFRNATVNCVSTQCPQELANAESLAQQFCGLVSVTLTFPTPTSASSPAPTSTSGEAVALQDPSVTLTVFAITGLAWLAFSW